MSGSDEEKEDKRRGKSIGGRAKVRFGKYKGDRREQLSWKEWRRGVHKG